MYLTLLLELSPGIGRAELSAETKQQMKEFAEGGNACFAADVVLGSVSIATLGRGHKAKVALKVNASPIVTD